MERHFKREMDFLQKWKGVSNVKWTSYKNGKAFQK
jgi:hypothetical protein